MHLHIHFHIRPQPTITTALANSLKLVDIRREREPEPNTPRTPSTSASRDNAKTVYVRTRTGFEARKPSQLSFAKGDIIQVIDSKSGKWHHGMLVKSKQYPVTSSKALFYPSNFVQPVTLTGSDI